MGSISRGVFEAMDATITLIEVGDQAFLEVDGDNFHCSVTLNAEVMQGMNDWFTCLRMSK